MIDFNIPLVWLGWFLIALGAAMIAWICSWFYYNGRGSVKAFLRKRGSGLTANALIIIAGALVLTTGTNWTHINLLWVLAASIGAVFFLTLIFFICICIGFSDLAPYADFIEGIIVFLWLASAIAVMTALAGVIIILVICGWNQFKEWFSANVRFPIPTP